MNDTFQIEKEIAEMYSILLRLEQWEDSSDNDGEPNINAICGDAIDFIKRKREYLASLK